MHSFKGIHWVILDGYITKNGYYWVGQKIGQKPDTLNLFFFYLFDKTRCNAFWDKPLFKQRFVSPPLMSRQPWHCFLLSNRIGAPPRTRVGPQSLPRGSSLTWRRTAKTSASRGQSQVYETQESRQSIWPMCCVHWTAHKFITWIMMIIKYIVFSSSKKKDVRSMYLKGTYYNIRGECD